MQIFLAKRFNKTIIGVILILIGLILWKIAAVVFGMVININGGLRPILDGDLRLYLYYVV